MNPAQLLAQFDRLSDAPDAIPRLRRFILDLAVRGKLIEQTTKDEPVSELLKRIQAEKVRSISEGRARKSKDALAQGDIPFNAPAGWEWVPFGEAVRIRTGKLDANAAVQGGAYPFFTCSQTPSEIDSYSFDTSAVLLAGNGDFNLKCYQGKFDAYQRTYVIEPLGWNLHFCFILMKSQISRITENQRGSAIPYLKLGDIADPVIPLPPLAEQHRIVSKVDELMALCDRLEAAQAERESRRDRLVASSLNRLNNGADPDAFRDHARFYFSHLPRLTTKPEHIQQLRQTILNLAVRGKLVPQDASDEPASVLLKHIQAEQKTLIKDRVLKPNLDSQLLEEELPIEIPPTWQWISLGMIIVFGPQNGISPKPSMRPDAPRAITLTATTSGRFDPQHFKRVEANIPQDSEYWLRSDDLLFQRGNTREYVGIAAYYTGEPRLYLYPDLMMKVRVSQKANLRYIHLCATAPFARTYFSTHATGAQATMPKINQGVLLQLPIPFPPLAEQQRIVAKVDELMALCDRLEAQLTTTHSDSRRLLDAVLHEALTA